MQTNNLPEIETAQAFLLRPYQQRAVEWAKSGADGLIIAPAGSGKTLIASSIIKHFARWPEWAFGWLAPTRETCQQAIDSLVAMGVDTSRVEVRCPHESVDFSRKNLIIVDECKHSPAKIWHKIIDQCKGLRFGFDATPWCDDPERNEILRKMFRDTQFEIRRDELAGVLAHATVFMNDATDLYLQQKIDDQIERLFTDRKRYMRVSQPILRAMCAWEALTEIGICGNKKRNEAAIMLANISSATGPTLVLVPRVSLGEFYVSKITGSILVHSKMPKKTRQYVMQEFLKGHIPTMIATSMADEGLDLPNVETLIMVSGGRSAQKTIQRASRALRRAPGKDTAIIHDFKDTFHPLAQAHSKKRVKCYKELGCSIL
ncbi:MAG: ATP-dependent RNA helicase SrmB [Nitrospira sp.]|nr:ATP-dependent RNA helicase SrmB [Nitrospira sp.]